MPLALPTQPSKPAAPAGRLAGDLAVWLIILAELLAFSLMFVAFAVMRARHPQAFAEARLTLDASAGLVNTWLLMAGSWCVVRAVLAVEHQRRGPALGWLGAAQACGAGFVALKWGEYAAKAAAGIDIETSPFFMFYFLLTGFHFLHVLAAMVFLGWLMVVLVRGPNPRGHLHAVETGAAFWHMVDLLWIVLFPLLYLLR